MTITRVVEAGIELFAVVVRMSWQASVVIVLVLSVQWGLRRRLPAVWRHALWVLVLLRLLIPVILESRFSFLNAFTLPGSVTTRGSDTPTAIQIAISQPAISRGAAGNSDTGLPNPADSEMHEDEMAARSQTTEIATRQASQSASSRIDSHFVVTAALVWLLGVVLLAMRTTIAALRLAGEVSRMLPATDDRVVAVMNDCCRQFGIRQPPKLVIGPPGSQAVVVGLIRPVIVIPRPVIAAISMVELRHILLHELVHVRRGDLLWNWAAIIATGIHWFNPLVWYAASRARLEAELASDAQVLGALSATERTGYGFTLLRLLEQTAAVPTTQPAVSILGNKNTLHERMKMIANYEAISFREVMWGLAASIAICLTGLTCAVAEPQQGEQIVQLTEKESTDRAHPAVTTGSLQSKAATDDRPASVIASRKQQEKSDERAEAARNYVARSVGQGRRAADIRRLDPDDKFEILLLHGPKIKDSDLERLAEHPELTSLALYDTSIQGDGLECLARLPLLKNLTLLGSNCTDTVLNSMPELPGLRRLTLLGTATSEDALTVLAKFKQLDTLHLEDVSIDRGLDNLRNVPELTHLWVLHTDLSDTGLVSLELVPKLKNLGINEATISDAGLKVLKHLKHLERFDLRDSYVQGPGLAHLTSAVNLKELTFNGLGATDAWLQAVAPLRNVEYIGLYGTQVTGAGLFSIRDWSKLKRASLNRNKIDDSCVEHLADLYRLQYLELLENRISEAGVANLRAALPDTSISY